MTQYPASLCPRCGLSVGGAAFCSNCGGLLTDRFRTAVRAPRPDRLLALLINAALIIVTLGLGWLLLWFRMASQGQSPGMAIVGLRVVNRDGTATSNARMFVRLALAALFFGWLDYAWMFVNSDGRTLHDLAARTVVVKAVGSEAIVAAPAKQTAVARASAAPPLTPAIAQATIAEPEPEEPSEPSPAPYNPTMMTLRRLDDLRGRNIITEEEYQERRQAAMERM